MTEARPDPDALLKRLQQEEKPNQGRLKVFLGASAGVGKTYAMLAEAHQLLERGVDVVIGLIETHGRKETDALVRDLPKIPTRPITYRAVTLQEFDLDAVLVRRPEIVLIDELAHSNAPGSRHPKRWQDVEEILASGISVYTAVNIQHLESLKDVVAQISGVQVRESVPDSFIERADEIELVDISPDELRERLREGKVYVQEQIDKALDGFFKKGNLIALRELALRRAADQVDAQMQTYRENQGVRSLWAARERVLVCVAPNRLGEKVVRAASRIGSTAHAQMYALYVESDRQQGRAAEDRQRADDALRLAADLGMETARRSAHDIVGEILRYAQLRNVSLIVVGKPIKPRWREILHGSVVDELVRRSGEISVQVITSEEPSVHAPSGFQLPPGQIKDYLLAVFVTAVVSTFGGMLYRRLPHENVVMLYLLGISLTAARTGIRAALLCSLLSVAAYDFFFIEPRLEFSVSDAAYLPTFGIMFGVAILISSLTSRLKAQAEASAARERRTGALYDVSREMAKSRGRTEIAVAAARRIAEDFDTDVAVLLPNERGRLTPIARSRSHFENDHRETPVAQWSFDNGKAAGSTTDTLPSATGLYLPLRVGEATLGVLALKPHFQGEKLDPAQRTLLETFANGLALAIERAKLAREGAEARLEAESEKLRSALLSSVSHDIRSPLTAIAGAASALVEEKGDSKTLAETIFRESQRLNRHVRDLLDMTRLESGAVEPNLEWNSVEEIVGGALTRTEIQLQGRKVGVSVDPDLPLVHVDAPLIEQALVNLLENAVKHTSPGTPIELAANLVSPMVEISVVDHGAGLSPADREHVFEKFIRKGGNESGFGLGLAITRAIARIHEGEAKAAETPGGGATFLISFPVGSGAPTIPAE
ncbi:MAG TPA: sensor histidine kinase KdpD [Fimbriimonas sp.]|nr:sensor histidine kinase KdpD [Fimbriimonas sp.]